MIEFHGSLDIAQDPARVFAFVAELQNLPKYRAEVVQSTVVTPGPVRIGTQFQEVVRLGPARVQARSIVTEYDGISTLGFSADAPQVRYQRRVMVVSVLGGTRVTLRGSAELKGAWRLLRPLLAGSLEKGVRKDLEALKRLTEGTRQPA